MASWRTLRICAVALPLASVVQRGNRRGDSFLEARVRRHRRRLHQSAGHRRRLVLHLGNRRRPIPATSTPSTIRCSGVHRARPRSTTSRAAIRQYVLGFNEPERPDQANMTVAQAISSWTTISNSFTGTNTKLVSPAVADTGEWTGLACELHEPGGGRQPEGRCGRLSLVRRQQSQQSGRCRQLVSQPRRFVSQLVQQAGVHHRVCHPRLGRRLHRRGDHRSQSAVS